MSGLRPGGGRGALAAEWRKMRRQRFPYVAFGLSLGAILLHAAIGIEPDTQGSFNGYYVAMAAAQTGFATASFLVLIYASTSVAGEATGGTLKLVLVRPISRRAFLGAKITVLVALAVGLTLAIGATAWLLGLAHGYGNLVDHDLMGNPYTSLDASRIGAKPVIAVALALPALIATAALGLLVSTLTDSAATAATTAVILYLPLQLAAQVFLTGEQLTYLFTEHLTRGVDRVASLALAESVAWETDASIVEAGLAVPAVTAVGLFALALVIYPRRNIAL